MSSLRTRPTTCDSRRAGALACLLLAAGAGGCSWFQPTTEPLAGPPPRLVAISPAVPESFRDLAGLLTTGLGEALAARGYRTSSRAVVAQLVADAGGDPFTASPVEVARTARTDAVLVLAVRRFEMRGERPLDEAAWDLQWRLVTAGGLELWRHEARGSWRPGDAGDAAMASSFETEAQPEMHWIGGAAVPTFRDAVDLVSWLHRSALTRLPRAPN